MSSPEPLPLEIRALALKRLIAKAEEILKRDYLQPLSKAYPLPRSVPFESPLDGSKLGYVQRTRTTPEWLVVSLPQLTDHFRAEFPNALEIVFLLDVPGHDRPVELPENHPITVCLAQHAPDLLTPAERVPSEAIEAALEQSRSTGEPAAPGIQLVRRGQGNLNVVPDKKEVDAALSRLVRAGRFDWREVLVLDAAPDRPDEVAS
jgi:hypothetical protein